MDLRTFNADPFRASYLETALWSSVSPDHGDRPLDRGDWEVSPECLDTMAADCASFREKIAHLDTSGEDDGQIAHDFWLTRNGHGAGFWDGDYPEALGEALTEIAESFGECDLLVGDDGQIHVY